MPVYSALSCNLDAHLLTAAYPLLAEERVEAIEWSFDTLYKFEQLPSWFEELLQVYSREGRLVAHGVYFSLFSGHWSADQQNWLNLLKHTSKQFPFDHITEHFGFMTGKDFHQGAPLSIPYTAKTLAIGQDRLKRIQEAGNAAVGLENLAFSYSLEEVKKHGEFLEKLVQPVNGFIILDLHNLYCQTHNFNLSFEELLGAYPLDLVREIHISGGSWDEIDLPEFRTVRRDTHDDSVPLQVFEFLEQVLERCPHLKFVVLEQLGTALATVESHEKYRQDFNRMEAIVQEFNKRSTTPGSTAFKPGSIELPGEVLEDEELYKQQAELTEILETAENSTAAFRSLKESSLANTAWEVENWAPYMLETAIRIARKWKNGFE